MIILGFDTSHSRCSVALSDGDKVIGALISKNNSAQAEELLIMTESLLEEVGMGYGDIDYLAVTRGPGSFTGIRIGLAAARGIVMGSKIRPISMTCFEAINFRTMHGAKKYDHSIVLINAHRGQLYVQSFDPVGVSTSGTELIELEKANDYISGFEGKVVVGGSGVELIRPLPGVMYLARFPHPEARCVCRFANMLLSKGSYSDDLSPLYIRLPDAKISRI